MKTKNTLLGLLLLFSISILTSCSIDKRIYSSGYSIQWHSKNVKKETKEVVLSEVKQSEPIVIIPVIDEKKMPEIDNSITASIEKKIISSKRQMTRSDYKRIISMPMRNIKQATKYVESLKSTMDGGDKSRNWAAILGFVMAFLIPVVGIVFCCLGLKSEMKGLALAGIIVSVAIILLDLLFFIALTSAS